MVFLELLIQYSGTTFLSEPPMEPPTERSAGLYIRLQIRVLNAELDWSVGEALLFRKLTKQIATPTRA